MAGGDDEPHLGELAEKQRFILHGDGTGQQILLVDARLFPGRHAGENVAGKKRLGEPFRLPSVAAHANGERQVVLEAFRAEERGKFFLAARFRLADEPAGLAGIGRGRGRHVSFSRRVAAAPSRSRAIPRR